MQKIVSLPACVCEGGPGAPGGSVPLSAWRAWSICECALCRYIEARFALPLPALTCRLSSLAAGSLPDVRLAELCTSPQLAAAPCPHLASPPVNASVRHPSWLVTPVHFTTDRHMNNNPKHPGSKSAAGCPSSCGQLPARPPAGAAPARPPAGAPLAVTWRHCA